MQTIIFRQQLFKLSEAFITEQAQSLVRYSPIYLGRERHGAAPPNAQSRALSDLDGWGPRRKLAQLVTADSSAYRDLLGSFSPRLIHAHFGVDALYAARLSAQVKAPLVTTFHGFDATTSTRSLLLSRSVSLARYAIGRGRLAREGALFLCVSEAIRQKVLALGFPEAKVVLHYIGVDVRKIVPRVGPPALPSILHVGRLVEKKGTACLIQAFALAAKKLPEVRLKIVGDGPLRRPLVRLAEELGVAQQVQFAGALDRADVLEEMRRATLLAVPSVRASNGDSEGLPTVLLEAAAAAIPAVGTFHSGIPEAILDGRTGHLVAERDVPALADRLTHLLANPQVAWDMGLAARALAEERFNLQVQTSALERLYDTVS